MHIIKLIHHSKLYKLWLRSILIILNNFFINHINHFLLININLENDRTNRTQNSLLPDCPPPKFDVINLGDELMGIELGLASESLGLFAWINLKYESHEEHTDFRSSSHVLYMWSKYWLLIMLSTLSFLLPLSPSCMQRVEFLV